MLSDIATAAGQGVNGSDAAQIDAWSGTPPRIGSGENFIFNQSLNNLSIFDTY